MTKILITGSTGFIGDSLSNCLENNNYELIKTSSKSNNKKNSIGVNLLHEELSDIFFKDVEIVIHLSGIAHKNKLFSFANDYENFKTLNVDVPKKIYESSIKNGVKKFIFFSSIGANYSKSFDSFTKRRDLYNGSKSKAEEILQSIEDAATELVIIRPGLVYGPDAPGNLKLLETLIKFKLHLFLPVLNNRKSLIHIDDVCEGVLFLIKNKIKINSYVNFIEDKPYTLNEIISSLDINKTQNENYLFLKKKFLNILKKTPFIKNLLEKFLLDTYLTNDNLKEYGYSYKKNIFDLNLSDFADRSN
tara:strand:- start:56 stop:967 length:912 start_codon:yes stop_codon:yes gene_type:complete